jgi:uncharacterized protein (TIGR02266 family)
MHRRHARFEVEALVDLQAPEGAQGAARVGNISLGGICIQTGHAEEVGTEVDLRINFPDLDLALDVRGEVVWANREQPCDIGIRYLDMDASKRATLLRYLESVREAPRIVSES